ncbi:MAG: thiamine pyrophosphate-dependent dehydrogenase E1 component subunit alpha [Bryobacterales bacterium]|nr:thiamine pyrophosphate-dependent dehydrogenase E1 component subunit alpha [Bryobacterales bacterium]
MAAVKPVGPLLVEHAGASRATAAETDAVEGLSPEEIALRGHYYMALQREVEDRIERKLYRQGKILGGVYVGRGQEAICVGAGLAAEEEDWLYPCHRDLGLYLVRGVTPREIFAQYMGRVGGLTRGREGNMHMGDLKRRIVAIISAMAASVPVAAGTAMALKFQGSRQIVFNIFGDGATSRGDWHEGINLASVQKAPVVFICNNNQYAYSTPLEKQMACEHVADRAPGYGMPGEIVDGNDVFAVYNAVQRAAGRARAGQGPSLIECKTFRMTGHSAHDGGDYVPEHLWREWAEKCPIQRVERTLLECGWASREELDATHARIRREADEAIAWAENSPYPDPSTLTHDVYEGSR